ncbi:MAG: hypothetical protein AB7E32_17790 [Desulfovibrio sp.]
MSRVAWRQSKRTTIVLMMLLSFLATSCASKYGVQKTQVKYCPECYQPIKELRDAEAQFRKTVATGTVVGALLGAVVGYATTGKASGVAVGAGAGAAAGAGAGYVAASEQEKRDDNAHMAQYLTKIDGDISGLTRVSAAAKVSLQCYDEQFKSSVQAFKNGAMSKEEFSARYAEIKSGSEEAVAIMGNVVTSAREREAQYQAAIEEQAKRENRPVPVVTDPAPAVTTKSKSSSKAAKTKTPATTASTAKSNDSLQATAEKNHELNKATASLEAEQAEAMRSLERRQKDYELSIS